MQDAHVLIARLAVLGLIGSFLDVTAIAHVDVVPPTFGFNSKNPWIHHCPNQPHRHLTDYLFVFSSSSSSWVCSHF